MADTIGFVTIDGKGGRPFIGKRRDIRMSDEHWQFLIRLGDGQAARGLRVLIDKAMKKWRDIERE